MKEGIQPVLSGSEGCGREVAPRRCFHPSWERYKGGENTGEIVAEFQAPGGCAFVWAIPPGSVRPLTYRRDSMLWIGGGDG